MKTFSTFMAALLALGLTFSVVPEAEAAKRLGGGSSSGMQRDSSTMDRSSSAAPAQAPAPSQAAKAPASQTPGAAPQAPQKRSWMGPLAGIAAGLGLAALASHFGFGEELASMMLIGLLVMAVLVVVGLVMRRRAAAQQPAMAAAGGMAYGGANAAPRAFDVAMPRAETPVAGGAAAFGGAAAAVAGNIPADFDVAGFTRQAKVNFIRLQAANDSGNLEDLREFTTPEMFGELKLDILGRSGASQQVDVVEINAEVLEVVEEPSRYVVSVRYTGWIREEQDGPTEAIAEVWHLVKPRQGNGGWLLAGIQQLQ